MTDDNSWHRGFGDFSRHVLRRIPAQLAILPACLLSLPAQASSSEWLNFPMYSRDSAHAVHLKALKLRPDGLLEAASRYPGHNKEMWSAPENAQGQHEYERRLIDCQSGLHFTYETRLLARDGSVVASRCAVRRPAARRPTATPTRSTSGATRRARKTRPPRPGGGAAKTRHRHRLHAARRRTHSAAAALSVAIPITAAQPQLASNRLPRTAPLAMPENIPTKSTAFKRLRAPGSIW